MKILDSLHVRRALNPGDIDLMRVRDPADILIWKLFHGNFHMVLVFQPELQHIELQHAYGTHDDLLHARIDFLKNLYGTFECDLINALCKLLPLHGVRLTDPAEMIRRKGRNPAEAELLPRCDNGIADFEDARIKDADNVTGVSLFHDLPLFRHHLLRLRQPDIPFALDMINFHTGVEFSGHDPHKCDSVPVGLIHICLNFKNKGRERVIKG